MHKDRIESNQEPGTWKYTVRPAKLRGRATRRVPLKMRSLLVTVMCDARRNGSPQQKNDPTKNSPPPVLNTPIRIKNWYQVYTSYHSSDTTLRLHNYKHTHVITPPPCRCTYVRTYDI